MKSEELENLLFGPSIFKNEKTLFQEFVPPDLPGREAEIRKLAQNFRPLLTDHGSMSVNVAVIGNGGIGKTAMVKYTLGKFVEAANKRGFKAMFVYYNCHTMRTKASILRNLLTEHFGIQSRGFGDDEIMEMLTKRLSHGETRLILVIDEANLLKSEDILSIYHMNEHFGSERSRISTVMISRPSEWTSLLNVPLSGHIHDQMMLDGYDRETIRRILVYRGKLAFRADYIDDGTLDLIIDIVATTRNARYGLEILYRAGKIADSREQVVIKPEYVRAAKAEVYPELRRDIFSDLNKHELITALSVSTTLETTEASATTIDETFGGYQILCEEYDEKARSKGMFRNYLGMLKKIGIVGVTVEQVGNMDDEKTKGRRSKITLYDIPAVILSERVRGKLDGDDPSDVI